MIVFEKILFGLSDIIKINKKYVKFIININGFNYNISFFDKFL